MFDVLVTGADQRQGLAVIRALGSRGLRVFAAGASPKSLGFCSRYTAGFAQVPSSFSDKKGFALAILSIVKEKSIPLVMPAVESSVIALNEHREEFQDDVTLAIPRPESLRLALDKRLTLKLAGRLNIPIPRSCEPGSLEDALEFAKEAGYPLVIKPPGMASLEGVQITQPFKVDYALDSRELKEKISLLIQRGDTPLLQEYCPGGKVNQGAFFAQQKLWGLYQYKGLREYPLTGGVTSVHVSTAPDDQMRQWTASLLEAMEWDGPVMVEYRVDEQSGRKVLMEVNGRFWAPQSAANRLGLNFPFVTYQYFRHGKTVRLPDDYPEGRKNIYLRGELTGLYTHLLGQNKKSLQPLPGKGRVLFNILSDLIPIQEYDVLEIRDFKPACRELYCLFKEYGRKFSGLLYRSIFRRRKPCS
jgi:predicted ATP-grasp superfamily ATP-dependent carboligase